MDNLIDYLNDNSILIIPNNIKEETLNYIRDKKKSLNVKIFSLDEFIKKITFDYDEKAIDYLMKSKNINYNISKLYLDNIRYVDNYSDNFKLNNLYNIKNDVDNLLIKDKLFLKLIKDKNIIVYGYDYINRYQLSILNNLDNINIINKTYKHNTHDVYRFDTLENEVVFVAEEISELLNNDIDINNIFIANLDDDYRNVIKRVFDMYNIPINLKEKNNIYETYIGKYFIENLSNNIDELLDVIKNKFDMSNKNNYDIYKKIINVINKFYFTDDYLIVKDNIIEVMKNTFINNTKYANAINEIILKDNIIDDNNYVFLVGFNLNKYPSIIKDEDYINDDIKPYNIEKSVEMNIINKELYFKIICNIKNLYISFKEKYLNDIFYPSLLIDEYNMDVIYYDFKYSKYSDIVNKILLAKSIDDLIKFNDKYTYLSLLYSNYNIPYNSYDNRYSGIEKESLYKFLDYKYNLSYSSMDNFYHCSFKFYLSNILKIDKYEDTIQTYIGNLFHYVLSKAFLDDFDFDESVKYFLNNNSYPDSFKNKYFLNKVLDELNFVIETIRYQNTLGNMDEAFYERKINVEKGGVLNINFKGFIDKLLKKDNNVVIIDYKTYMVDINLNYLPYGLSMQLPVYLYLTKNIDKDYEIIGFYLQQILFGKFNKEHGKTLKEQIKSNLRLKGYSIGNESRLAILDTTYEDSELIHGMKLTNKGFSHYSKVLTDKQIDNIVKITDAKINECIDSIENSKFDINPKMISGKNIGCTYCKYKDICFMNNRDIVELEDIKDLSFLD